MDAETESNSHVDLMSEIQAQAADIEVETVIHHRRPSFSSLKAFCKTRWSCLFHLTECHIKNFGNFVKICFRFSLTVCFVDCKRRTKEFFLSLCFFRRYKKVLAALGFVPKYHQRKRKIVDNWIQQNIRHFQHIQ